MAEYEVIKTTLFGGYKKSAVQEVIQRLKDEMAEQEASFRKEIDQKMPGSKNCRNGSKRRTKNRFGQKKKSRKNIRNMWIIMKASANLY